MTTYHHIAVEASEAELDAALSEYGAQGWELVSTHFINMSQDQEWPFWMWKLFFKRIVPKPSDLSIPEPS